MGTSDSRFSETKLDNIENPKKAYVSPVLTEYGSIIELTANGSKTNNENASTNSPQIHKPLPP